MYRKRPVEWDGLKKVSVYKRNSSNLRIWERELHTAWKVSVFGVFLVLIFPHWDWLRTQILQKTVHLLVPCIHKMVKHSFRIFQHLLQDFYVCLTILWTLGTIGLRSKFFNANLQCLRKYKGLWDSLDRGQYHIETSRLIYSSNQWAGFCMIGTSAMKELTHFSPRLHLI